MYVLPMNKGHVWERTPLFASTWRCSRCNAMASVASPDKNEPVLRRNKFLSCEEMQVAQVLEN